MSGLVIGKIDIVVEVELVVEVVGVRSLVLV